MGRLFPNQEFFEMAAIKEEVCETECQPGMTEEEDAFPGSVLRQEASARHFFSVQVRTTAHTKPTHSHVVCLLVLKTKEDTRFSRLVITHFHCSRRANGHSRK